MKIPIRMIQEFGCADWWIGIVQYDSFARLADRHIAEDGSIYANGPVSYGVPGRNRSARSLRATRTIPSSKRPSTHIGRSIESSGRVRSNVAFYQTRITLTAKLKNTAMRNWT